MASTRTLQAAARDRVGKGAARALRRDNKIPAVIYGEKKTPVSISLDRNAMSLLLNGGGFMTSVFEIEIGGKVERVIPRDFQVEPVRDTLIHIDFLRVGEGTVVAVDIPVHFLNQEASPGIKRGGVLNIVRHEIELYVPADRIPEFLEADLSGLDINDSLHLSAITLPEGTRPVTQDRDFTIATIAAPSGDAEPEAAAPAA